MATQKYPEYSVVMAVYKNDRPEWFLQAIDSLLTQTVRSNDIIIVVDGPLTSELDNVLSGYEKHEEVSVIRLPENKGLGNALNVGIAQSSNELIGRMDADDISVSNRFELQLAEFAKNPDLGILGGQIAEFIDMPDTITAHRKVPVSYADIKRFAKRRSPFNHPTVMYKKSVIQKLGGYDISAIRIEDYDLWLRALSQGVVCANISSVLLNYRATADTMQRRRTFMSLQNHIKARARFYKRGDIAFSDFMYGVSTQVALFVLPAGVANTIFDKVARNE